MREDRREAVSIHKSMLRLHGDLHLPRQLIRWRPHYLRILFALRVSPRRFQGVGVGCRFIIRAIISGARTRRMDQALGNGMALLLRILRIITGFDPAVYQHCYNKQYHLRPRQPRRKPMVD